MYHGGAVVPPVAGWLLVSARWPWAGRPNALPGKQPRAQPRHPPGRGCILPGTARPSRRGMRPTAGRRGTQRVAVRN